MTGRWLLPALVLALGLGALAGPGCVTGTSGVRPAGEAQPAPPPRTEAPVPPTEFQLPPRVPRLSEPGGVDEPVPGGDIDWSGNVVRARGTGVVDPGMKNPAQARLMAERAAVVVAQRNLLEIVKGVRVDSETRVENFMTDYDVVYSRVEGYVKGARQRGPARYDSLGGTVEVELEMEIYGEEGLSDALIPALGAGEVGAASLSPQVRDFLEQYSGLVFDGGAAGLRPSMFPKIYDENGNLLLDTRDYAAYLGSGGQATLQFISDLDRVLARPEFARSPLVLKVRQVTGRLGSDIILGGPDADKLKWLKDGFKYLLDAGRFLLKVLL
ncbi:hypothetical protein JXB37_01560 [candidate division WOR-3 bacterium]|nr:hypothetical protein [candidate division WOR-3 bacterium]